MKTKTNNRKLDKKHKKKLSAALRRNQKPNSIKPHVPIGIMLFTYRQHLKFDNTPLLDLLQTKHKLTERLIRKVTVSTKCCTIAEWNEFNFAIKYKKVLKGHIRKCEHLEKLGVTVVKAKPKTLKLRSDNAIDNNASDDNENNDEDDDTEEASINTSA